MLVYLDEKSGCDWREDGAQRLHSNLRRDWSNLSLEGRRAGGRAAGGNFSPGQRCDSFTSARSSWWDRSSRTVGQSDAEVTPCSAAAAAARLPPPLETFILNISEFVTSSGARGRMCWSETLYNFIQRFR